MGGGVEGRVDGRVLRFFFFFRGNFDRLRWDVVVVVIKKDFSGRIEVRIIM